MLSRVKWLGHATVMFTTPKIIYIDPYRLKGAPQKADIILITHDHYDHLSESDIEKIRTADTIIVIPEAVKTPLPGDVRRITIGATISIADISIEAVPAYNIGKQFHPKSAHNAGYIVTIDNTRYYHAGDTDIIPEMDNLDVDVAFLPVGGTYTMDAREAAEASQKIQPKIAVPIHYNSIIGSREDARLFKELCSCPVEILPEGE
ncbi:MAG: MBL fold metallo-hydrolase [Fidelibacterota bacterium]